MSNKFGQTTLEVIAPSVEEAVQKGLEQLNLPEDAVEVEVLDRGNKGLFGLGSRDARIRLVVKATADPVTSRTAETAPPAEAEIKPDPEPLVMQDDHVETQWDHRLPAEVDEADEEDAFDDDFDYESDFMAEETFSEAEEELTQDEAFIVNAARSTVADLLDRMNVTAEVSATYRHPEIEGERPTIWVDITGKDLSVLIGRRSQTLQALQYITTLILGKELERSVPLVIDVEGYRSRREAQLRRLAETVAEQAIQTGRTQALEPMTASERRIIHITLRNNPDVSTESIGEDPHRKVTITPHPTA